MLASRALTAASRAVAQERVASSAERSWEIQRIASPAVSPDGRTVVAAVTRHDLKDNKGLTDLWLWSADGKVERTLTTNPASDSSPLFSPDGQSLAFVSQRNGDTAPQLYVMPLAGGEATRVTSVPTGVGQPMWFPDGRRIAFVNRVWADLDTMEKQAARLKERTDSKSSAQAWDGGPIYYWDTWLDDRQLHVLSVGVEGGEPVNLTVGTGLELPRSAVQLESPLYDISPDGKELAFVADSVPASTSASADSSTSASTTFTRSGVAGNSYSGTMRCTVTDTGNANLTATVDVTVATTHNTSIINHTSSINQSTTTGLCERIGAGFCTATTTPATTVSITSGGSGSYTYSWAYVSGSTFTANSPNSASTTFSKTASASPDPGAQYSGVYRCTITDTGNSNY